MTDSIMSKAATMEIPINSNGDTGTLTEDDSLEQVGRAAASVESSLLENPFCFFVKQQTVSKT